jgi:hypothetical protein
MESVTWWESLRLDSQKEVCTEICEHFYYFTLALLCVYVFVSCESRKQFILHFNLYSLNNHSISQRNFIYKTVTFWHSYRSPQKFSSFPRKICGTKWRSLNKKKCLKRDIIVIFNSNFPLNSFFFITLVTLPFKTMSTVTEILQFYYTPRIGLLDIVPMFVPYVFDSQYNPNQHTLYIQLH